MEGERDILGRGDISPRERLRWAGMWLMDTALPTGGDGGGLGGCIRSGTPSAQSPG